MSIFAKERELIVMEENVLTLIQGIGVYTKGFNGKILAGNNTEGPAEWIMRFETSDKRWNKIVGYLNEIGKVELRLYSNGKTKMYFVN